MAPAARGARGFSSLFLFFGYRGGGGGMHAPNHPRERGQAMMNSWPPQIKGVARINGGPLIKGLNLSRPSENTNPGFLGIVYFVQEQDSMPFG